MAPSFSPKARARRWEIAGAPARYRIPHRENARAGRANEDLRRASGAAARRRKLRFCRITILVGEPLYFAAADVEGQGREVYPRVSQRVMDAIAALRL